MADIPNRKFYRLVSEPNAPTPSFPSDTGEVQNPVNPPGSGGGETNLPDDNNPNQVLKTGTFDLLTETTADANGWKFQINYEFFDAGNQNLDPIEGDPTDFSRGDSLLGNDSGDVEYLAGEENEDGIFYPPTPSDKVLLGNIIRNTNGTFEFLPVQPSTTDFVSVSKTTPQSVQGQFGIAPQATSESLRRSVYFDANGFLRGTRVDYHGVYSTLSGSSNWSRLIRVDGSVNNQGDYRVALDLVGVKSQKGSVWVEFSIDGSGDMVANNLQLFGDYTASRFKMVKIASFIYDIFVEHTETADFFKWRPRFSFGSSDKYTYYHQETLTSLPTGDQYSFKSFGDENTFGGQYRFNTSTTDSDPGTGKLAFDNATISSATELYLDPITYGGLDITNIISPLKEGDVIYLQNKGDAANFARLKVTGDAVDETGWFTVPIEYIDGNGAVPGNNERLFVLFNWGAGAGGGGADTNAVHYNAADGKTLPEKSQARANIGSTAMPAQVITNTGFFQLSPRTSNYIQWNGSSLGRFTSMDQGTEEGEEVIIHNISNQNLMMYNHQPGTGTLKQFDLGVTTVFAPNSMSRWKYVDPYWVNMDYVTMLRKDVADTKTGHLTMANGSFINFGSYGRIIFPSGSGATGCYISLNSTINSAFWIAKNDVIYHLPEATGIKSNVPIILTSGTITSAGVIGTITFQANSNNGRVFHARSGASNESIRRDEQRLYYPTSVTTSGAINDQEITDGIFNYRFTNATAITGLDGGEEGRTIDIDNDTGATLTLNHEDAGSIAANRIKLIGATNLVIPIDGKATLKYCDSSRWELVSKNF